MSRVTPVKIEFHTTELDVNEGVSQRTGKPYSITKQKGYLFIGDDPYPERIEFQIEEGKGAYSAGKYFLDLNACATVDRFGSIGIDLRKAKLFQATEPSKAS
jgi:hypothetical protein